jgi:integrase
LPKSAYIELTKFFTEELKMARQKLTPGRINSFPNPQKGQVFIWDSEVPGLGIRATASAKVYIMQAKLYGKDIRIKIGDTRSWHIDGARQEARRLKSLMESGTDPRNEKKERIAAEQLKRDQEKRESITLLEIWPVYLKARQPKWGERHYQDHIALAAPGGDSYKRRDGKTKPGPLATLMPLKLSEITHDRIEAWLKTESIERGARVRLAFSLLRAFFKWCDTQSAYKGLTAPDVCSSWLKREYIPKMEPNNDCLQREQLKSWFEYVIQLDNLVMSSYLQALLLTGARKNELADLQWADVDFQWDAITIRDKVSGKRTIPLTPYVKSLISQLPRRNTYVFSSPTSQSGRVTYPRQPHDRALVKAQIPGLTIHGLRRSFGTLSEWVECPTGVVAQIMGHKPSATAEKHYRQRPLDLLRMWHNKIERWILGQAGLEQPENDKTD